ncbi:hypothetical protein HYH03_003407 [Edaphochlamys debaryana]|uniref:Cyclin-like domain-containing protein n=1 Tax=Edaphochlamys debaryana TaxID=47281 RepID=A0A835Y9U5_9CHLO|nr:hypothetical protein HYH03_003407 [Edaphochlamys debaryana]|eukprot:KAG2498661.1 hypothetical protein HYH03_003407 [Edaphochlamys debaryana]
MASSYDNEPSSPSSLGSGGLPSLASTGSLDDLLLCTEDAADFFDQEPDREEYGRLAEQTQELAGCLRFELRPVEAARATAPEIAAAIRDDLQKQHQAARMLTESPRNCERVSASSGAASLGSMPAAMDAEGVPCHSHRRLPPAHRARVVGWMQQVHTELGLQLSTLFSAVSLLDRFAACATTLPPDHMLQLLALSCMSVATKYNEVAQVHQGSWLDLAVDTSMQPAQRLYGGLDLQRMEWLLLQTTGWLLHTPNAYTFLAHYLACLPQEAAAEGPMCGGGTGAGTDHGRKRWLPVAAKALALAEISLMYDSFLSYDHSAVAMACVALAEQQTCAAAAAAFTAATAAAGGVGLVSIGVTPRRGVAASTVATLAVVATSGLPMSRLARELEPCTAALERCQELVQAQLEAANAAAASAAFDYGAYCGDDGGYDDMGA